MNEQNKFRKKPVVIEAVQFDGSSTSVGEIMRWMDTGEYKRSKIRTQDLGRVFEILTLEGVMKASPGDWIIKGVNSEFYPCKPDIFAKSYEPEWLRQKPVGYWEGKFDKDGGASIYEVYQESLFGFKYKNIPLYTTPPAAPDVVKELDEAKQSLDFYRRRVEALQSWQSKMRDPERTVVCDIIANGCTLPPENAGDRYKETAAPDVKLVPFCRVEDVFDNDSMLTQLGVARGDFLYTTPPAAPDADTVPMPTTVEQAKSMALLGQAWLEQHAPNELKQATPEFKGWYCAHCQRGVDGSEVTFNEQHQVCGRVITDDVPPLQPTLDAELVEAARRVLRGMKAVDEKLLENSPSFAALEAALARRGDIA